MAILNSCKQLEEEGYEVSYIGVDSDGIIRLNELENTIRNEKEQNKKEYLENFGKEEEITNSENNYYEEEEEKEDTKRKKGKHF